MAVKFLIFLLLYNYSLLIFRQEAVFLLKVDFFVFCLSLFCVLRGKPHKLVRKQSNEIKAMMRNDKFLKFVPSTSTFDFLPAKSNKSNPAVIYKLPVRLVRFKITDDTYEVVATNLSENEFSPVELKQLYALRWGIETSFRDLKYTVGLLELVFIG